MLLGNKSAKAQLCVFGNAARKCKAAGLLFLVRSVYIHKACFFDLGSRNVEIILSGPDLYRNGIIDSIGHAAGRKSSPDQLIQSELVSGQRSLDSHRRPGYIRRSDGFMGILRIAALIFTVGMTYRVLPVLRRNISFCRGIRFVSDSCRICTQISDYADRAFTGNVNTLVELLGNTHVEKLSVFAASC